MFLSERGIEYLTSDGVRQLSGAARSSSRQEGLGTRKPTSKSKVFKKLRPPSGKAASVTAGNH